MGCGRDRRDLVVRAENLRPGSPLQAGAVVQTKGTKSGTRLLTSA